MSFAQHDFGLALKRERIVSRPGPEWPKDPPLSVCSGLREGRLVIEVVGSVTLWSLDVFAAALVAPDTLVSPCVTVDLCRVDFLDSSGLALLAGTSKHLRSLDTTHAPRVLVTAGRQPDRALRLGRYGKILEIVSVGSLESGG